MRLFIAMLVLAVLCGSTGVAQTKFRSGIFLHHSTGACIWGPNGASTSVPDQLTAYNTSHSYTGSDVVTLTESSWPVTPWDNEWERWHRIFYNQDSDADIRPILTANRIVMIKSCFPSSDMSGIGAVSDTAAPAKKTSYNYKWHWRKIVQAMKEHPSNFFVIWTNAPLVTGTDAQGALADNFCRWAKDTLAAGLDAAFGPFPKNVYVFDFFHALAVANGRLPLAYAASSGDSHPNAAATALVAPALVREVFTAAIAYEKVGVVTVPPVRSLISPVNTVCVANNFPNPFNPSTTISFSLPWRVFVTLKIFDVMGREVSTIVSDELSSGNYSRQWNASGFPSGVYFYRIQAGASSEMKRLVLLK